MLWYTNRQFPLVAANGKQYEISWQNAQDVANGLLKTFIINES